jgi:hypothetical protein
MEVGLLSPLRLTCEDGKVTLDEVTMFTEGEKALLKIFFEQYNNNVKWSDTIKTLLRRMDSYLDIPLVQAVFDDVNCYGAVKRLILNQCKLIPDKYMYSLELCARYAILDRDSNSFAVFVKLIELMQSKEMTLCFNNLVELAAKVGRKDIVQCFRAIQQDFTYHESHLIAAAKRGEFETVKYLYERNCKLSGLGTNVAIEACTIGHLDMFVFAIEHGCSMNGCMNAAACYGHVHILEWMKARHFEFETVTLSNAMCGGHLKVVKLLVQYVNVTQRHARLAIKYGYLDIVKFLYDDVGLEIDHWAPLRAAEYHSLPILQYLYDKKCVMQKEAVTATITNGGHSTECLRFMLEVNWPHDDLEELMKLAIKKQHFDAYIVLYDFHVKK